MNFVGKMFSFMISFIDFNRSGAPETTGLPTTIWRIYKNTLLVWLCVV